MVPVDIFGVRGIFLSFRGPKKVQIDHAKTLFWYTLLFYNLYGPLVKNLCFALKVKILIIFRLLKWNNNFKIIYYIFGNKIIICTLFSQSFTSIIHYTAYMFTDYETVLN